MSKTYSVSELVRELKSSLEEGFQDISVSGEISFRDNAVSPSGHFYFSMKDENSQLRCVMWNREFSLLDFKPQNGQQVTVRGRITVYAKGGDMQLSVRSILRTGLGELMEKLKKLRAKLVELKMTDEAGRKIGARPIPELPQRIGVVTSATGAAIKDILSVLDRRFANIEVLVYPVKVQGDGAGSEIAEAVDELNKHFPYLDVLLVGRGGGSIEDLWAFNEERVVMSIFNSAIPVISCVGHEIDFTLADCVADLRAPTPSAAAEMVVKNKSELEGRLYELYASLAVQIKRLLSDSEARLAEMQASSVFRRPETIFENAAQKADRLGERFEEVLDSVLSAVESKMTLCLEKLKLLSPGSGRDTVLAQMHERLEAGVRRWVFGTENRIALLSGKLKTLGPENVLSRGYSITVRMSSGMIVRDASELSPEEDIKIRFGRGYAAAQVKKTGAAIEGAGYAEKDRF